MRRDRPFPGGGSSLYNKGRQGGFNGLSTVIERGETDHKGIQTPCGHRIMASIRIILVIMHKNRLLVLYTPAEFSKVKKV